MTDNTIVPASSFYLLPQPAMASPPLLNVTAVSNIPVSLTPMSAQTSPAPATTCPSQMSILRAWRNKKWHQAAAESQDAQLKALSGRTSLTATRSAQQRLPQQPEAGNSTSRAWSALPLAAITEWAIKSWAQTTGSTPVEKVINLLCRDDRPNNLSGETLAAILTSLPDGAKMSPRAIADLLYLSNTSARAEALAWVISRWHLAEGKSTSSKLAFLLQQRDCLQNFTAKEFFISQQFLPDTPDISLKTITNQCWAAGAALRNNAEVQPPSPVSVSDNTGRHPSPPPSPALSLTDLSELAAMPSPWRQVHYGLSCTSSPAVFMPDDDELSLPSSQAFSTPDDEDMASLSSPALSDIDWSGLDEPASPSPSLLNFCEQMDMTSRLSSGMDEDDVMPDSQL